MGSGSRVRGVTLDPTAGFESGENSERLLSMLAWKDILSQIQKTVVLVVVVRLHGSETDYPSAQVQIYPEPEAERS